MLPVKTSKLTKIYKAKKGRRIEALVDLDLEISPGEVIGYLGPNGAGKSTTIKALLGQVRPSSGSAELFGLPACDSASRQKVGYLPENPSFYDSLTACEYLAMVGGIFGLTTGEVKTGSERVLELLDLTAAARRPIRSFSKGMVQRLGIAQTMLHDPDLYILDEPMSGLDPLGRALVKKIMLELKERGKTVFFSTHVTADVEAVCDRVGIIVAGRLQTIKPVQDVLEGGIEGYEVHVGGIDRSFDPGFELIESRQDIQVYYVAGNEISSFMLKIGECGGEVHLMEPRRKNLEAFFLDIVKSGRS